MLKKTLCLFMLLFSTAHAAEGTVYYTELTCDPKQDVFEMKLGSIAREALATQKPPLLASFKEGQQFAVFLNGKPVGEKAFKYVCKLQDDVSIEMDIDYGKRSFWYLCGKNIPERYKALYPGEHHDCLGFSTGELFITQHGKALAGITNDLTYNGDDMSRTHYELNHISYEDQTLHIAPDNHAPAKKYSLQQLQRKSLLSKLALGMSIIN